MLDDTSSDSAATTPDEGARRLMNLLFVLNASRSPLTTEQILSDSDLGYGSDNRGSDLKKFKRDRDRLAQQGIAVREVKPRGAAENEESCWEIDDASTYAETSLITQADAEELLDAIDALLQRTDIPYASALDRIRLKVLDAATGAGAGTLGAEGGREVRRDPIIDSIWAAYVLRKQLPLLYRDGAGNESRRTVAVYGIISMDGRCYFVGMDSKSGQIRTFRADRVQRCWKPKGSYRVPADFNARDYVFLPFDLAAGEGAEVAFTLPGGIPSGEVTALTRGRGALTREDDGSWTWRVTARSLQAAAAFSLAHAAMGMRPLEPLDLRRAWNHTIEEAVRAHGED